MSELETIEVLAKAIRNEIVRQYRDDDRGTCPAGAHYYEENIQPWKIAHIVLATLRAENIAKSEERTTSPNPGTAEG